LRRIAVPRPFYLAIEGVIGVGKTALARLLQPRFQADLLLEVFEENPFLSDFYADRQRYAFQTQIFFLLSRYRQQQEVRRNDRPLIADYTFAKDRLFAHLNLQGDELATYERLHQALAEKVVLPDLVVYLQASLDVLMARIATRDRPYERGMDPAYIESLRQAYERHFASYDATPLLVINTDGLDFVRNPQDLAYIEGGIL
jgi:Deoxynucleoside kinases